MEQKYKYKQEQENTNQRFVPLQRFYGYFYSLFRKYCIKSINSYPATFNIRALYRSILLLRNCFLSLQSVLEIYNPHPESNSSFIRFVLSNLIFNAYKKHN